VGDRWPVLFRPGDAAGHVLVEPLGDVRVKVRPRFRTIANGTFYLVGTRIPGHYRVASGT
jgi:hypothetical protein